MGKNLRIGSLRISSIVKGRANRGSRVIYCVDPTCTTGRKAIPEDVVLLRWRKKKSESYIFHGCRLSPNLWRAVDQAFGRDAKGISSLSEGYIATVRDRVRSSREKFAFALPDAQSLWFLFQAFGAARLQVILDRHLAEDRVLRFGTPDLFLYAVNKVTPKRLAYCRLVEVKRPKEPVSQDQQEEIAFLRSINMHARVFRLIENI